MYVSACTFLGVRKMNERIKRIIVPNESNEDKDRFNITKDMYR